MKKIEKFHYDIQKDLLYDCIGKSRGYQTEKVKKYFDQQGDSSPVEGHYLSFNKKNGNMSLKVEFKNDTESIFNVMTEKPATC